MGLSAGTRLGPDEIVSTLGVGGMGEVYRARDSELGPRFRKTLWAVRFGALTDRFGIPWAINCEKSE